MKSMIILAAFAALLAASPATAHGPHEHGAALALGAVRGHGGVVGAGGVQQHLAVAQRRQFGHLSDVGIAASSGSACTSGKTEPSHVLTAMGLSEAQAHCTLRISTGAVTSEASLDALLAVLPAEVARIRAVGM